MPGANWKHSFSLALTADLGQVQRQSSHCHLHLHVPNFAACNERESPPPGQKTDLRTSAAGQPPRTRPRAERIAPTPRPGPVPAPRRPTGQAPARPPTRRRSSPDETCAAPRAAAARPAGGGPGPAAPRKRRRAAAPRLPRASHARRDGAAPAGAQRTKRPRAKGDDGRGRPRRRPSPGRLYLVAAGSPRAGPPSALRSGAEELKPHPRRRLDPPR